MYAMDARQYDPAIARWIVQDPVAHFNYSPYVAFDNNPIFWVDPSGMDSYYYDWNLNNGTYVNYETGETTKDYDKAISETQDDISNGIKWELTEKITHTWFATNRPGNKGTDKVELNVQTQAYKDGKYLKHGFTYSSTVFIDEEGSYDKTGKATMYYESGTYYLDYDFNKPTGEIYYNLAAYSETISRYIKKYDGSPLWEIAGKNKENNENIKTVNKVLSILSTIAGLLPKNPYTTGAGYLFTGASMIGDSVLDPEHAEDIILKRKEIRKL